MLSVGTSSSCDVCFESFDANAKAPTSITCGHVFCNECIVKFRTAQNNTCPMCRTAYDYRYCAKLHVDADGLSAEKKAGCTPEELAQASKIQKAISAVADEGITEPKLRQLIQEGRTFLHSQPRHLHKELRIAHRMISYLCETKASLRAQTQEVETLREQIERLEEDYGAQIEKLNEEKEKLIQDNETLKKEQQQLRDSLSESESTREMDRDTALAVEASLRAHVERVKQENKKAKDAYLGLLSMSNQLSTQYEELKAQLSQKNLSSGPYRETYKSSSYIYSNSSSSVDLVNPLLDRKALRGVAMQHPKTPYLISPLPQFTTVLPEVPLPELADDSDEDEDEDSEDEDEDGLSTPDSDQPDSRDYPNHLRSSATVPEPPPVKAGYEPSGLSRSAPYREHQRRARASSNPLDSMSRSHSPHGSIVASTPPTSPPYETNRSAQSLDQHASTSYGSFSQASNSHYQPGRGQSIPYSRNSHPESIASSTPSTSPPHRVAQPDEYPSRYTPSSLTTTPQPRSAAEPRPSTHQQVNVQADLARLQNILSDAPTSSSLPIINPGKHFPPSYGGSSGSSSTSRETASVREQRPSPPPRTDSSSSHTKTPTQSSYVKAPVSKQQQQSTNDDYSHLLASSSYQASSSFVPSTSPNLSKGMSTASAHAAKLEDEKRARRKQEEDQRKRQQESERQQEEQRCQEIGPKYFTASASAAAAAAMSTAGSGSGQAARRDQPQQQQQQQYLTIPTTSSRRGTISNATPSAGSYPRPGNQFGSTYDQGVYS